MRKLLAAATLLFVASLLVASAPGVRVAPVQARPASGVSPVLVSPMRIAGGPPGQVLVSDSRDNTIVGVDEDTQRPIWSAAIQGTPMAIGYAPRLVFVGNASTHNVEAYRMTGALAAPTLEFQFNFAGTPAGSQGGFQLPSDLSVDETARLAFVLDGAARRVKVFDLFGKAVTEFPAQNSPAPLLSPTAIAIDPAERQVFVSDYGDPNGYFRANIAARIMVYTYDGDFVTMFDGGVANRDFQFTRPQGLAVDSQGRLFMVESLFGQVFVFDRATGIVREKLGDFGDGPGELMLPLDLVVSRRTGDLLVTNNMRARIEVFRQAGGAR